MLSKSGIKDHFSFIHNIYNERFKVKNYRQVSLIINIAFGITLKNVIGQ